MLQWLRFCTSTVNNKAIASSYSNLHRTVIYCNFNTSIAIRRRNDETQSDQTPNENGTKQNFRGESSQREKHQSKSSQKLPAIIIKDPFREASNRTKSSYLDVVEIYKERSVKRRNHVEFIYAALKHMPEFNVQHDLQVYKALIDVMPKAKFIPTNVFQAEFMHYPKQQQCIIDLLEQMEDFGVMPDYEMEAMLMNIFGRYGHPLRKYWRMMYWMPKFKNLSPWPLPNPVPDDALIMAKLAVERMCTVDVCSKVTVFDTSCVEESIDRTWIVSGMSPDQTELLKQHPPTTSLYIEGPFLIWLRNKSINYFTLRADPILRTTQKISNNNIEEEYDSDDDDDVTNLRVPTFGHLITEHTIRQVRKQKTVHEQEDGTIFAICATGTSTKDSLLSWIRLLERNGNPSLANVPVLFRFRSNITEAHKQIEANISNK